MILPYMHAIGNWYRQGKTTKFYVLLYFILLMFYKWLLHVKSCSKPHDIQALNRISYIFYKLKRPFSFFFVKSIKMFWCGNKVLTKDHIFFTFQQHIGTSYLPENSRIQTQL